MRVLPVLRRGNSAELASKMSAVNTPLTDEFSRFDREEMRSLFNSHGGGILLETTGDPLFRPMFNLYESQFPDNVSLAIQAAVYKILILKREPPPALSEMSAFFKGQSLLLKCMENPLFASNFFKGMTNQDLNPESIILASSWVVVQEERLKEHVEKLENKVTLHNIDLYRTAMEKSSDDNARKGQQKKRKM